MTHAKANTLICPRGCKASGGYPIAGTIRGWKKHMSHTHGGYTEEELAQLLGNSAINPEKGKAAFLAEADSVLTPESTGEPTLFDMGEPATPKVVTMRTDAVSRKLSGRMNKFKRTIAEKFPEMVNAALKEQPPEIQLSQADRDLLTEGVENSLDVLEVDFQVAPISKTLTSPWWALMFPMLALLIIFVPRLPAILEALKKKRALEEENREPVETVAN